ncbi:NADH-quinone oxidoreductase subunit N [Botrimarina colliarenosi]|uniref:NADH-quinone oxidoreductase subunit N n=1 Tax=Botrimarina colliarenosi TaxID=2528001 RepID=A0A5C6AL70_9BACT|nr:NADH-quinone oxidoreductase subunit N [Botrimarina colliarenosi]TWU00009.1 NADH-quinone oxidoreductase subunit N [Botrimarina colliarenosi]
MLPTLVEQLANDTAGLSLPRSAPEVTLVVTIVALLLARVPAALRRIDPVWIALTGALVALGCLLGEARGGLAAIEPVELFTGMLRHDALGVFSRGLLLMFLVMMVVLSKLTGLASRDDGQDFFVLLFGATLGMCVMCRANHLMTVVLGIEMASVPSYVLVGIVKGRRRSGEAALKYSVYGAAAAGVMLYGVSLLAGLLGSVHLPTLGLRLAELQVASLAGDPSQRGVIMALALAGVLVLVGMAFKLSAAPFHFWAPDVFAGAPAEVGAFLSVASKTAALVLLLRLVSLVLPHGVSVDAALPGEGVSRLAAMSDAGPAAPARAFVVGLIATAAAVTCTLGNLAALSQTNAKRLLAYSTIAHAGYLLMPIAAAIALAEHDPAGASGAAAAVMLYAAGYLFLNFTAFAAVAAIRNTRGAETIEDYAGLIRTAPVTAVAFCLAMIGLLGLPPLVGFWGKLAALRALVDAGGPWMVMLLVVAVLNTALSLVYYLRVVKTICLDAPPEDAGVERPERPTRLLLAVGAAPILLLGIAPEWLARLAGEACQGLFG